MTRFANKLARTLLPLALSLPMLLAACSGDSADTRKLSALTAADKKQVCTDAMNALDDGKVRDVARFSCALAEIFQPSCDDARINACVDDFVTQIQSDQSGCDDFAAKNLAACDITVDEYVTCQNDEFDVLAKAGHDITCANFNSTGTGAPAAEPASCNGLKARCAVLFDDGSSSGNGP